MIFFSAFAAGIFILLFFVPAPYGKYIRDNWGPNINNKLGWFIMELPTVIIYILFFLLGYRKTELVAVVFLCIWLLHYMQRTFIFPFLIRGKNVMPITIILFGLIFNSINPYLQSRWINTLSTAYTTDWLLSPFFVIGLLIFFSGFVINLHSDHIIRNLRHPGESEYKIPYGGVYRWVSCPNYLGEITEWTGWALMTFSFPGLIFASWTFANLAPRARSNHKWYLESFPDYPENRKALIPYLF